MKINISVNHKSNPKLINNFYRHCVTQNNYICEKERERERQRDRVRERKPMTEREKGRKMFRMHAAKKSILNKNKNKYKSSN